MSTDMWKPNQYNKFKDQQAQPFGTLVNLVQDNKIASIIDLGCGTGELTAQLQQRFPQVDILGVDSSASMLKNSKVLENNHLKFECRDILELPSSKKYDLVFSNAALQWLLDHEHLFPQLFSLVSPHGQIAIQMPFNFDHPSHRIAHDLAENFEPLRGKVPDIRKPLEIERYSELLYKAGFKKQHCRLQSVPHPMDSGQK